MIRIRKFIILENLIQIEKSSVASTSRAATLGANITLEKFNKTISFWCVHLYQHPYGPYLAASNVTKVYEILLGDFQVTPSSRILDVMEMLNTTSFKTALEAEMPLIVAGDFNTPSHLDWTEATKHLHNGWVVQWPVTYLLQTMIGLKDSFRELFPDPLKNPGSTWTTLNASEPQDRIDFIMYKGSKLTPFQSFTYSGDEAITQVPNVTQNDYPSDHFAVITDFYFNCD